MISPQYIWGITTFFCMLTAGVNIYDRNISAAFNALMAALFSIIIIIKS